MRRTIPNNVAIERSFTDLYINPAPLRPGSENALRFASRIGNTLHHRGGRVTDLAGNPLKKGTTRHD